MGDNTYGELGDGGSESSANRPEAVASNVAAVAAGANYSLFLTGAGNLLAMGQNSAGQLGDGLLSNTNRPVLVGHALVTASLAKGSQASHRLAVAAVPPVVVTQPILYGVHIVGTSFSFTLSTVPNQSYQIQYTATLAPPNWINVGSPITASSSTTTVSAPIGSNAQGYYRVVLSP